MVVYYYRAVCYAEKKLVHYLQFQGRSEGLYNKNMIIFTVSSTLLIGMQPNLV